jgi:glyoxylase-like metal-dependent hydrolase (beta-lactamase superfamily II)
LFNQRRGSNRLLVLLDAHPDRTLGARTMECTILAHQQAAEIFRNRPMIFKGLNAESGALWETYSEAIGMRWTVPDITFLERMVLHWGGPDIILEHRPGPSAGAVWVIIPELQIIFVGDAIAVDQPVFLAEADMEAWLAALDELKNTYKDYKIISGRGGMVDLVAILRVWNAFQRAVRHLTRLQRWSNHYSGGLIILQSTMICTPSACATASTITTFVNTITALIINLPMETVISTGYAPVLELTRGDVVESIHRGAIVVVDVSGNILAWYGDPNTKTYLRSAAKPFQILPFLERGGMEEFGITEREVALMCASHSGTDDHVAVLKR